MVYDNFFNNKQQFKSIQTADAAMQVANIMEEQNRLNDAKHYVQIACETYKEQYGAGSDISIIASWLNLQIHYTQSDFKPDSGAPN